jgi:hypothetical protein
MSGRAGVPSRSLQRLLLFLIAGVVSAMLVRVAWAGLAGFRNSAVGGISISADGVVGPPSDDARNIVLSDLRREFKEPSDELNRSTAMRMISLRALNAACDDALKAGTGDIPDELRYLAGIQRIQYVFVYPDEHDIVLAGPGEGWKVDDNANVVGVTTGRPVLRLDDLLVALRSVEQSRQGGITCSIDPTKEGLLALRNLLDKQRDVARAGGMNTRALEMDIKREFGNQLVSITGVPATSHFARVLVASDYRMKRLAMELERSPVAGLPSYVQMISKASTRAVNNANPRWWLACNYEPLAASDDRLAWELRGPAVKALTEDEVVSDGGRVEGTGKASPMAQKWADLLTEKYDDVSGKISVFAELRNLMDLCVIGALLEKEGLWDKAGLSAPVLCDPQSPWKLEVWNAPKAVPPEVSFVKVSKAWIVTASGGVQLTPWQVASQVETSTQVAAARSKATPNSKSLWWQ